MHWAGGDRDEQVGGASKSFLLVPGDALLLLDR